MNGTNVYKCHADALCQRNPGTKFSVTSIRDIEKHQLYNFITLSWKLFFFCLLFQSQNIQNILEFCWQTRCSNQGLPADVLQQNPAALCQRQQWYTRNVSQNAKHSKINKHHSCEFLESAHIVHTLATVRATKPAFAVNHKSHYWDWYIRVYVCIIICIYIYTLLTLCSMCMLYRQQHYHLYTWNYSA